MARGNLIVVTANPKGRFDECIISGTPLPGSFMELVPNTALQGGRATYRKRSSTAGSQGPVAILREDGSQGKTATQAYANNDRGFLYFPLPGDELNALVTVPGTGTGTIDLEGQLLECDANGGLTPATATADQALFQAMEKVVDSTSAVLTWVQRHS